MIKGIDFKEHDGYLQATIDGQTLPLKLKEIIKDEVTIHNIASTGIPLYTSIPINIELTTKHGNIIESGPINIKIFQPHEDEPILLYEEDGSIIANEYKSTIDEYLDLGTYIVEINYYGGKYFTASKLSYYLTVEKRPLLFKMDKDTYHGKPYEDIDVHLEIYDALNKNPISNTRIDYVYNNIHYITKSDAKGGIDFQITVPDDCSGDNIFIYILNDIYEYTTTNIKIITDRLRTEIHNTYSYDMNNLVIDGNVFAYNGDNMYNAQYGDIELYIENEYINKSEVSSGIFQLKYNYYNILKEYVSAQDTKVTEKSDINVKTKLILEENMTPGEVKFVVQVNDYNKKKVTDGMVYFQLNNDANYYITEVDENGEAICYFYLAEKRKYKIKYRYFGMFEYKDSEIKEETIEVK